jgi:alanyl-tRNA synthetase
LSERLYYHDSFLRDFDAFVVSCEKAAAQNGTEASATWWVTLQQSAFYPTSGGQPHDTGRLGDVAVLDVFEREDGTIVHVTNGAIEPGPVRAAIDWSRRFDHMQQHTGSHVLSAAFQALFDIPSVSFHMGKSISTIDVAASSLSEAQLESVERHANEIIFDDRPVHLRYGTAAELAALGVSKESAREGVLRAVEIQGVDIQACGGTHVCRTGQIGLLVIRRVKKVRENWRVEFVCGQRARQVTHGDFALLEDISQRLTCGPDGIHAAITRLVNERNAASRVGQRYMEESAKLQAQLLLAKERAQHSSSRPRTVICTLENADMEFLRTVANNLIVEPGLIALLGSEANGFVVFAKSESIGGDMNALLRDAAKTAGGKGGGTKDFAQGNLPPGSDLNRVLRLAAELVSKPAASLHVIGKHPVSARPQASPWRSKGKARG